MTEKEKKTLGPSKYANSKKKKQKSVQNKKPKKDPFISKKDHDLKVKIKNIRKEIKRIENSQDENALKNKKDLEKKLEKLLKVSKENAEKSKQNQLTKE